jgi:peptidoglycan/xylan/chitin deacetylase (PgdA/CDA1 family)
MKAISRIHNFIDRVYRQKIACEQYPMLSSIDRKKKRTEGAIGLVYMLHHITEKDSRRIPTNEDLKVSPEFLEKIILKYKAKGFDFISLDRLNDIIMSGDTPERPFIAFTIDDGYLDNYTKALPVFERHQVPFTIFVSTDFIDKKAVLWWDSIEDLIMTHPIIVTGDGKRYLCETFQQRWDTFRYLRERILCLDQSRLEYELEKMFTNYQIDWYEPVKQKGMSWDHVVSLANHPLCTIGAHTITHPALSKLTTPEAFEEMKGGRERIEREISQPVSYFAYPYGTPNEVSEREIKQAEDLGFNLAFCAHGGCVTKDNKSKLFQLPRVYFRES